MYKDLLNTSVKSWVAPDSRVHTSLEEFKNARSFISTKYLNDGDAFILRCCFAEDGY